MANKDVIIRAHCNDCANWYASICRRIEQRVMQTTSEKGGTLGLVWRFDESPDVSEIAETRISRGVNHCIVQESLPW